MLSCNAISAESWIINPLLRFGLFGVRFIFTRFEELLVGILTKGGGVSACTKSEGRRVIRKEMSKGMTAIKNAYCMHCASSQDNLCTRPEHFTCMLQTGFDVSFSFWFSCRTQEVIGQLRKARYYVCKGWRITGRVGLVCAVIPV